MSHMMNGKPIWCPSAPTKSGSVWTPEDLKKEDDAVALSELPRLIEAAIKAGLVQRPSPEDTIPVWRKNAIEKTCKQCAKKFWAAKSNKLARCVTCRIPAKNCVVCDKVFHPTQRKYVTCSEECANQKRIEGIRRHSEEQWAKRPKVNCPICGVQFPMRFSGGKPVNTCGKECGVELFRRNHALKRAQREANQAKK